MLLMKYKPLLLFLGVFFVKSAFSQENKYVYYFDDNLKSCSKALSVFTGVGNPENDLIKFTCFYNTTKQVVVQAYFTDSTLKIFQGLFQSWFGNRIKDSEGNYEKGMQNGLWRKWDSTGH